MSRNEVQKRIAFLRSRLNSENGEDAIEIQKELDYYLGRQDLPPEPDEANG